MSAPTPVRSAMVDALVRLECGDGCGFPSCECYAMTRPSIDMAKKRVLAVLDNLPREAMVSAMSQCSRTDLWAQILNAAIAAARSDAER